MRDALVSDYPAYGFGYRLGAQRRRFGLEFSPDAGPHETWMRPSNGHVNEVLRERRRGYRDGFTGRAENPEGKARSGSRSRAVVTLNVSIPPELAARVDAAAAADGSSRSAWVRAAIETKLGGG